jgi:hypothetical protein
MDACVTVARGGGGGGGKAPQHPRPKHGSAKTDSSYNGGDERPEHVQLPNG